MTDHPSSDGPLQCFRWGSYGHRVKDSLDKKHCFKCGNRVTGFKECRAESPSCRNCRKAKHAGFRYDAVHSMMSADYPMRMMDQRKIASQTDYGLTP